MRQRADVRSRLGGLDERAVLLVRGAQHLDYETHLMNVVLPREEGLPAQNLGQDAPHRPDINRARVILAAEQQLRRPVPPRDHVLGHEPPLRRRPRQAKVAYFQVAVRVQEQVAGLQIAVQHLRGVNVLEPAQDLVQEILAVLVAEALRRSQDLVEVRVHQLVHQVDVVEVILGRGTHDVLEQHDVLVLQPAKELDLAERPSRVRRVVEGVGYLEFRNAYSQSGRTGKQEMRGGHRGGCWPADLTHLLNRHFLAGLRVLRGAHHTVGTLADRFDRNVLHVNLEEAAPYHVALLSGPAACDTTENSTRC